MKLGFDAIITDALKELAAADQAFEAAIRLDNADAERKASYERVHSAQQRLLNLAKALFPAPPPAPKRACKPRPANATAIVRAARPATSSGMARAANDSAAARPRSLLLPLPQVEVTIIADDGKRGTGRP